LPGSRVFDWVEDGAGIDGAPSGESDSRAARSRRGQRRRPRGEERDAAGGGRRHRARAAFAGSGRRLRATSDAASGTSSSSGSAYQGQLRRSSGSPTRPARDSRMDSVPVNPGAIGAPRSDLHQQHRCEAAAIAMRSSGNRWRPTAGRRRRSRVRVRVPRTGSHSVAAQANVSHTVPTVQSATAPPRQRLRELALNEHVENSTAPPTPANSDSAAATRLARRRRSRGPADAGATSTSSSHLRDALSGEKEKPVVSTTIVAYPATIASHASRVRASPPATASAASSGATPAWTAGFRSSSSIRSLPFGADVRPSCPDGEASASVQLDPKPLVERVEIAAVHPAKRLRQYPTCSETPDRTAARPSR